LEDSGPDNYFILGISSEHGPDSPDYEQNSGSAEVMIEDKLKLNNEEEEEDKGSSNPTITKLKEGDSIARNRANSDDARNRANSDDKKTNSSRNRDRANSDDKKTNSSRNRDRANSDDKKANVRNRDRANSDDKKSNGTSDGDDKKSNEESGSDSSNKGIKKTYTPHLKKEGAVIEYPIECNLNPDRKRGELKTSISGPLKHYVLFIKNGKNPSIMYPQGSRQKV